MVNYKNWVNDTPPDQRVALAQSIAEIMHEAGEPRDKWVEVIPRYLTLAIGSWLTTACSIER